MKVQVLLATYNGERFLKQQLASLVEQTYQDFEILIRDDGSRDGTLSVIEEFCAQHPSKARLLPSKSNQGAIGNFLALMRGSTAEYLMFCDQDDVWLPTKIERTLSAMLEAERNTQGLPLLVHSDLIVTNENLDQISDSFFRMQRLSRNPVTLERLFIQNHVTGCTVMVNQRCVQLALRADGPILMHDWWLALIATAFGKVIFLDTPTILYRQHASNTVGADKRTLGKKLSKFAHAITDKDRRMTLASNVSQAKTFLNAFAKESDGAAMLRTLQFTKIDSMPVLARRWFLVRNGFLRHGLLPNLSLLFYA